MIRFLPLSGIYYSSGDSVNVSYPFSEVQSADSPAQNEWAALSMDRFT